MEEKFIRIYGELTPEIMPRITQDFLEGCVKGKKITLLINSGGGSLKLYRQIKSLINVYNPVVKTVCIGDAYSTAGMIFLLGSERVMIGKEAQLLFHEPSQELNSTYSELKKMMEVLEEMYNGIVEEIFEKCHYFFTKEEVKTKLREGWYVGSIDAFKYGFATEIK